RRAACAAAPRHSSNSLIIVNECSLGWLPRCVARPPQSVQPRWRYLRTESPADTGFAAGSYFDEGEMMRKRLAWYSMVVILICPLHILTSIFGDVRGVVRDLQQQLIAGATVMLRSRTSDFS